MWTFRRLRIQWLFTICILAQLAELSQAIAFDINPQVLYLGRSKTNTQFKCTLDRSVSKFVIYIVRLKDDKRLVTANSDINNGSPKVSPGYKERGAGAELQDTVLTVTVPDLVCYDAGAYACYTETVDGKENATDTISIVDSDQTVKMAVTLPDETGQRKAISEGEFIILVCRKIYGVVEPANARLIPINPYWQWEYRRTKGHAGYAKMSGALSVFHDTWGSTNCSGLWYESRLTLYPLRSRHSNTSLRCHLMWDMKQQEPESSIPTFIIGDVGPPPPETPIEVRYTYSTRSIAVFISGTIGFVGSVLIAIIYLINRKMHCFGRIGIPKELVEEEQELDQLEKEVSRALEADTLTKAKPPPAASTPAVPASALRPRLSSPTDVVPELASDVESSFMESSVTDTGVTESAISEGDSSALVTAIIDTTSSA